ncbi:MAG TPA: AAA family ATPase [Candidatus Hydrogenedentes bacterium]|nr:AAA family ATPase [Candidatus Hydrogenedentota bacterium]
MSWDKLTIATQHVHRIYLWGPPGTGKSYAAMQLLPEAYQITLHADTVAQELMGHYVPRGGNFVWHDGPIAAAFRSGRPLVVNEVSRASGAVQDLMLAVCDDPATAAITLPTSETIRPAPGFQVIATSNHDPALLDEALRDRFDVIIHVTTPHPSLVDYLNSHLQGLGKAVADSYQDPERAISPRRALTALTLWKKSCDLRTAIELAFGVRATDVKLALRAAGVPV